MNNKGLAFFPKKETIKTFLFPYKKRNTDGKTWPTSNNLQSQLQLNHPLSKNDLTILSRGMVLTDHHNQSIPLSIHRCMGTRNITVT